VVTKNEFMGEFAGMSISQEFVDDFVSVS